MKNIGLAERISKAIGARNKDCFMNSARAMLWIHANMPDSIKEKTYVIEGYCVDPDLLGIPFMHGWVMVNDEIIDTTPCYMKKEHAVYVPVYAFDMHDALRWFSESQLLPCRISEFGDGLSFKGYIRALLVCNSEDIVRRMYEFEPAASTIIEEVIGEVRSIRANQKR